MIGYAVTINCVTLAKRSRPQAGVIVYGGSMDVAITSPEAEINLRIPFDQEANLDSAARSVLRRVASWARYISQTAEDELGEEQPVVAECHTPDLAVA